MVSTTTNITTTTTTTTTTTSSSFCIFRHVQNSVRKRMSWIEVLRAELLKTNLLRCGAIPQDGQLYLYLYHLLTFPSTWTQFRTKSLSCKERKGWASSNGFTYNPHSCFHHHQVIINNISSSVSNLRHGRPSPQTTSHINAWHSMSLQTFVTYVSWHHRYKLDGSNRFVCLITEVMGNKRQHALCKTANAHYKIMSGI